MTKMREYHEIIDNTNATTTFTKEYNSISIVTKIEHNGSTFRTIETEFNSMYFIMQKETFASESLYKSEFVKEEIRNAEAERLIDIIGRFLIDVQALGDQFDMNIEEMRVIIPNSNDKDVKDISIVFGYNYVETAYTICYDKHTQNKSITRHVFDE
jgi:hypothetical protein